MTSGRHENQLELFDVGPPAARPPHREPLGRFLLHARYDQLVLAGIAGLIGLTVVFACGVERGKQLVRAERPLVTRQQPASPASTGSRGEPSAVTRVVPPTAPATGHQPASAPAAPSLTPLTPKVKPVSTPGSGKSRYAVQVVTYSRPQLAKQELDKLRARGESAFLVVRDGRISVYVGPFTTKGNAQEKVAMLKSRYQDCFVKGL